jgi:hypothetical protein
VKLIIDSNLCEPPSEIYPFRDVTLYAKTYIFDDVLLKCKKGTRTMYWNWLKKYGAHDFISYIIRDIEEEEGFLIAEKKANLNIQKISYDNLYYIISVLKSLK